MTVSNYQIKESLILLVIILSVSLTVLAQTKSSQEAVCTLTLAQAPEIRGLRLGMTTNEVEKRLGVEAYQSDDIGWALLDIEFVDPSNKVLDLQKKVEVYGKSRGFIFFDKTQHPDFDGVRYLSLSILDGKVISIELHYYPNSIIKDADDFASKVSKALKLSGEWNGRIWKTLKCDGFEVSAVFSSNKQPIIQLEDINGQKTLRARQNEKEQQRKEFKP